MATLYEIDQNIRSLIDEETGEIAEFEAFLSLEGERDEKIKNTALFIINLESDAEQFSEQEKKFKERKEAAKKKAERLREYLSTFLNGERKEFTECKISFRSSSKVSVDDESKIPPEFWKASNPTLNKEELKKAMKTGEVPGAHLEETRSNQIK